MILFKSNIYNVLEKGESREKMRKKKGRPAFPLFGCFRRKEKKG